MGQGRAKEDIASGVVHSIANKVAVTATRKAHTAGDVPTVRGKVPK